MRRIQILRVERLGSGSEVFAMETNLAHEIAIKSAALPLEVQQEVLEFVEFKLQREQETKSIAEKVGFRSVQGVLQGEFTNLEQDISVIREESWRNFPRSFPVKSPLR
jgi:hypothetical protein